jgi:hypothetical protein
MPAAAANYQVSQGPTRGGWVPGLGNAVAGRAGWWLGSSTETAVCLGAVQTRISPTAMEDQLI